MRKLQFSLVGLLGVVSFLAVACAALAKPNEWWALGVTNASLAALFAGALAAIYGHAAHRAFWVGFAVVGWGYLVVGWANGVLSILRPDDAQQFVTTRLLEWLSERTLGSSPTRLTSIVATSPSGAAVTTDITLEINAETETVQQYITSQKPLTIAVAPGVDPQALSRFLRIGHSLWAIVLGVAGGLLARAFYFRRERLAPGAAASSG